MTTSMCAIYKDTKQQKVISARVATVCFPPGHTMLWLFLVKPLTYAAIGTKGAGVSFPKNKHPAALGALKRIH